jgi:hypothetical protein
VVESLRPIRFKRTSLSCGKARGLVGLVKLDQTQILVPRRIPLCSFRVALRLHGSSDFSDLRRVLCCPVSDLSCSEPGFESRLLIQSDTSLFNKSPPRFCFNTCTICVFSLLSLKSLDRGDHLCFLCSSGTLLVIELREAV